MLVFLKHLRLPTYHQVKLAMLKILKILVLQMIQTTKRNSSQVCS